MNLYKLNYFLRYFIMTEVIINKIKETIQVFEKKFGEILIKYKKVRLITLNKYHSGIKRKLLDSLPNMIVEMIYSYIDIYKMNRHRYCLEIEVLYDEYKPYVYQPLLYYVHNFPTNIASDLANIASNENNEIR